MKFFAERAPEHMQFPHPDGNGFVTWDGRKFVEAAVDGVLQYPMPNCPDGWCDELTEFHEEVSSGTHPIDQASLELCLKHFAVKMPENAVVLEIGCSAGHTLRALREARPDLQIIGADIIRMPLRRLASQLTASGMPTPILQFDLTTCPLPDSSIDGVIALNVLEHIENDAEALRQIHRILKPQGLFYVEVPAGQSLYDNYDRELHHFRRYARAPFVKAAHASGLSEVYSSHMGFFVYPPFWVVKKMGQKQAQPDQPSQYAESASVSNRTTKLIKLTSGLLMRLNFFLELTLGKWFSWPCGIRYVGLFAKFS